MNALVPQYCWGVPAVLARSTGMNLSDEVQTMEDVNNDINHRNTSRP